MLKFLIFLGGLNLSCQLGHAAIPSSKEKLHNLNITVRRNSRFTKDADTFILNSFADLSYEQCVLECSSRPRCKAVEYRYSAKYCSLRSADSSTVVTPGYLTVTGFDGQRLCGNVTCSTKEACDTNTNTCMIKDCGYPDNLANGLKFKGNRFGVGSKISYECLKNHAERICTEHGTWGSAATGVTCRDIRQSDANVRSGFFRNRLNMTIYCDFETDGGDWLVFQRRINGTVDFYQTWEEYKVGFGNICGEFWLGLEKLYTILRSVNQPFVLRIDLEDWEGNTRFARYDYFDLGAESDAYRLHCGTYSGNAGDSLNYQCGHKFTTYDRDNDWYLDNCAKRYHGAWWYNACHVSNLNGRYYEGGHTTDFATGVVWKTWRGYYYSLKVVSMKIREV